LECNLLYTSRSLSQTISEQDKPVSGCIVRSFISTSSYPPHILMRCYWRRFNY